MAGQKGRSGGSRQNSGRKTSTATKLKREFIDSKETEAEFGFALFCEAMRDEASSRQIRLYAASVVMDRVWGKAREPLEVKGALVTDDVSKLSPDERKRRIAELLKR